MRAAYYGTLLIAISMYLVGAYLQNTGLHNFLCSGFLTTPLLILPFLSLRTPIETQDPSSPTSPIQFILNSASRRKKWWFSWQQTLSTLDSVNTMRIPFLAAINWVTKLCTPLDLMQKGWRCQLWGMGWRMNMVEDKTAVEIFSILCYLNNYKFRSNKSGGDVCR